NFDMNNYEDYFVANYNLIVNPSADTTIFSEDNAVLNNEIYDEESFFDYTLTTPMRINAGATFFLSKNGFITADIEYVDYSTMNLKGKQGGSLESENEAIKDLYNSVVNLRVGGEWRLKAFRIRAGYNYQPSPYKEEDIERNVQTFSAGLGIRSSKYFVDLAASYKQFNSIYTPYILDNPDNSSVFQTSFVDIENTNLNIALTVGLFF
ncbi:MAG: hypothetical protein KAI29_05100, partial [Cyclobacteriaceae bacterium]|nr:hypothetical protein [Cyclobacteriaceae bacterium]